MREGTRETVNERGAARLGACTWAARCCTCGDPPIVVEIDVRGARGPFCVYGGGPPGDMLPRGPFCMYCGGPPAVMLVRAFLCTYGGGPPGAMLARETDIRPWRAPSGVMASGELIDERHERRPWRGGGEADWPAGPT